MHRRQEDFFHAFLRFFRCIIRIRRYSTHAAGVQPFIIVLCSFMIHRGHHRHKGFAIRKYQNGHLRTAQKFFNHNIVPAVSKHFVFHHGMNSRQCFLFIIGNDDTFSKRQTICFDDNGKRHRFKIICRRLGIVKNLICRRRYIVFFHEFL
ncbi:hypothetical protein SDC9_187837 [bioreactor metagenome]|uniref:Uncharacterized protein n=1 Tax=bioreactor metagenome TaxID=1076179 RepID=A0A645HMM0_9ZZZZ